MANMLNLIVIEGYLGADAEHRTTDTGRSLIKFSVGNSRQWKDRSGEKKSTTLWVRVHSWNENTKNLLPYLLKGQQVKVVGRLTGNTYQDQSGTNRTSYEVQADDILLAGSPRDQREDAEELVAAAPVKKTSTLKSKVQKKQVEEETSWDGDDDGDENLPW